MPIDLQQVNLFLLASDLVGGDDGGQGIGRQPAQLALLHHLGQVAHDAVPRLLVQLLQEQVLGGQPEPDGVGGVQLSSQPLEVGEVKKRYTNLKSPAGKSC